MTEYELEEKVHYLQLQVVQLKSAVTNLVEAMHIMEKSLTTLREMHNER